MLDLSNITVLGIAEICGGCAVVGLTILGWAVLARWREEKRLLRLERLLQKLDAVDGPRLISSTVRFIHD